jgi:hypothetical protein
MPVRYRKDTVKQNRSAVDNQFVMVAKTVKLHIQAARTGLREIAGKRRCLECTLSAGGECARVGEHIARPQVDDRT